MYNPFTLKDKRILVTGASSGIGRAIAVECSKMGATVILTARNEVRLNETLTLMDHPECHCAIKTDLAQKEEVKSLVEKIEDKLDGVVHCAGFTIPKPFQFIAADDIDAIMEVNYKAPALLSQLLVKKKKMNKGASIVFISSISGVWISAVGASLYSSSKGAVNGLAQAMAIELAPKSIRVNCVNPGMIDTNLFGNGEISEEQLKEDAKRYPLGRYGKPEEVAMAVVYLLSDASSWVTGTNLKIDGGYTLL